MPYLLTIKLAINLGCSQHFFHFFGINFCPSGDVILKGVLQRSESLAGFALEYLVHASGVCTIKRNEYKTRQII
jgi:hypothetical protein